MRIEKDGEFWLIVRGKGRHESYFCMFVDHEDVRWTGKKPWNAQKFRCIEAAEEALHIIRIRGHIKRSRREAA